MKVNAKKTIFIMSIFFTLTFAFNVFAEAELNEFWSGTEVVGQNLFVYKTYYDSGVLKIEITADDLQTSGTYTDDVYFRNFEYTFDDNGIKFKTSSDTNIFLKYFDCASGNKVNLNDDWSTMRSWCKISDYGTLTLIVYQMKYSGVQIDNYTGLTKTDIDNQWGVDFLESGKGLTSNDVYRYNTSSSRVSYFDTWNIYHSVYQNIPLGFPFEATPPEPVDGLCGLDDGTITNTEPPIPPKTLCQAGTATEVSFDGYQWTWDCLGINGGDDDNCVSYNTLPVDAICGADDGQTVSEVDEFCDVGFLIYPSFVETTLGWTWTCAGTNGGNYDFCIAYKSGLTPPDLPEQDDCSLQDIPDRWFCEISNSLKSIFLPDADKINELQETLNQINGRFPFNYLNVASNNFSDLKNSTDDDILEISILGNDGNINLDGIEPLKEKTKLFTGGLFIFGFIFWAIGYIKHFFK